MKKYLLLFTLFTCLCLPLVAFADEEDDEEETAPNRYNSQMNTQVDGLNRNVYELSKDQIINKGYRSMDEVLRYAPFIGITNVGLGGEISLRGQGSRASNSVKVLLNGVPFNMLDTSYGVTPYATITPTNIEYMEILPGGGAVMYGNGTRGGVVNIITQKLYEEPYFSAGLSYSNIVASTGNNINADAKYGGKIGEDTYISVGAAYIHRGGPRQGDSVNGAQANFALVQFLGDGDHSLNLDMDYFYGQFRGSVANSFTDIANPKRSDRSTSGLGSTLYSQQRFDLSLGYRGELAQDHTLDLKLFYHLNRINYLDYVFGVTGYRPAVSSANFGDSTLDQSGSIFNDQKVGLSLKYDWQQDRGRFIAGYESIYQFSKRRLKQHSISDAGPGAANGVLTFEHTLNLPYDGSEWTNALFAIEKYDFTDIFSLTTGLRYEHAFYKVNRITANHNIQYVNTGNTGQVVEMPLTSSGFDDATAYSAHNFALELTPTFRYRDEGSIYMKYEKGYFTPSSNYLLVRNGMGVCGGLNANTCNPDPNAAYYTTNLKPENYHTFELGLKDTFGDMGMLSISAFYTLTTNEIFAKGNVYTKDGMAYGNYDLTYRTGLEFFSEQYLFDGILSLSESFTYIDAKILKDGQYGGGVRTENVAGSPTNEKGNRIPYVSNYKATFGVNVAIGENWNIWTQNTFYGNQKDISGATIPAYSLTDLGLNARYGEWNVSAGIRNVFDTFYYTYYNRDTSTPQSNVLGYNFLIGQGRSIFIEGRYTF